MMLFCIFFLCLTGFAGTGIDNSLAKEAKVSMNSAVKYLISKQNKNGSWGPHGGHPSISGLCATAIATSPDGQSTAAKKTIARAEEYLLTFVQQDGSIWMTGEHGFPNYTTSISMVAFYVINRDKHLKTIQKARNFIKSSQFDATAGSTEVEEGGIGYGSNKTKSDLSNTQLALEALYITNDVEKEGATEEEIKATKKCWANAKKFLNRCQASPTTNDLKWAKETPGKDMGGFIYSPDRSKVEAKGLRVYGSMTYSGLKSMIYAGIMQEDKLIKEDPRVKAAMGWASRNYTLDENPGVGIQGHYYYIHTFTKALHAFDQDVIVDDKGNKHFWRKDVLKKLLSVQKADGHWVNPEGRWMENQAEMVTAFSLMSMSYAISKDLN